MNAVTDMAREGAALINLDLPEPTDISDIPNHPILQLIFFGNIEQEEAVLRGMPACEATRWTHLLCDIIPAEAANISVSKRFSTITGLPGRSVWRSATATTTLPCSAMPESVSPWEMPMRR